MASKVLRTLLHGDYEEEEAEDPLTHLLETCPCGRCAIQQLGVELKTQFRSSAEAELNLPFCLPPPACSDIVAYLTGAAPAEDALGHEEDVEGDDTQGLRIAAIFIILVAGVVGGWPPLFIEVSASWSV